MKLACADFSWPLLAHERVLALIGLLEVEGVDLALFGGRSHIRPEVVRADIPMWAGILTERLAAAGLELADFFVQPGTTFDGMAVNHPDPQPQEHAPGLFGGMLGPAPRAPPPG